MHGGISPPPICQQGVTAAENVLPADVTATRYALHNHDSQTLTGFSSLVPGVLSFWPERGVELVKTLRLGAAILSHSRRIKRTAKICAGLVAAVFLLQFYCVRELLFMEIVVALGFVVVTLIIVVYALGCIAALWLRKLASRLKALGALVSARHQQPFAKTTATGLSEAKEEVS
jgi:phosphotransferase system  glucose/maltose/N-acetylglucosamine-specific IIC component